MSKDDKRVRRVYRAPSREAAAERTRDAILAAAKQIFEERGWSGATMRTIATRAGTSLKTVEAVYKTKAGLLEAAVAYAIRGDAEAVEMPRREAIATMEAAPDAPTMLQLHAAHLRTVNQRSARIAWVVEHAAAGGGSPADLWNQMNQNRAFGVRWAAQTLLAKPETNHLAAPAVETAFWVALDWGTYRLLTGEAGLTDDQFEAWLVGYYERMFMTR